MTRRLPTVCLLFALAFATLAPARARAVELAGPLADLQLRIAALSLHAPGRVGIAVEDLATGMTSGYNDAASLPAASTIKIPVMVEVFKQMEAGEIDLNRVVTLQARDRDWGWGDMADAPVGTRRTVKQLLWLMITNSDNTATNELIRLVGRGDINATMGSLGLRTTHLGDSIRSETDTIRYALRTSPHDMLVLLDKIARDKMIDAWSSRQMLAILEGQKHNSLLPVPLPQGTLVAHKTGSLHDTLNDVGIVYSGDEPYVIAVMTTQLPDLSLGRAFIHKVSRIAYDGLRRFATWRQGQGIAAFSGDSPALADDRRPETSPLDPLVPVSPDERMWNAAPAGPAVPAPTPLPG
jgi:beta-lactamase class A